MASDRNPFEHLIPQTSQDEKNPFEHLIPKKELGFGGKLSRAGGILKEDISKIPGAVFDSVIRGINGAPSQLTGFSQQFIKNQTLQDPRFARNLISGVGKVEKGIVNIPSDIERFVKHLGLQNEDKATMLEPWPRQETNWLDKWFGPKGEEQPGDVLLQNLPTAATFYNPAMAATKLAGKGVGAAVRPVGNLISGKPKYAALAEQLGIPAKEAALKGAESEASEAGLAHVEQENALKETQHQAKVATGVKEPGAMEHKILTHQENLDKLNKNMQALNHQIDNLKPIELLPPSDIGHVKAAHEATQQVRQAEHNLNQATDYHHDAVQNVERVDNNIGHHLNEGADHSVRAMRELRHDIGSINNYWRDAYRDQMNNLRDSHFQLTNSDRLPRINAAVEEARARYGDDPTGEFAQLMRRAPNIHDTSAHDYMMHYKEFRDYRYNLLRRAQEEPSAVKRDELFRAYHDSNAINDIINETLQEGLGDHAAEYARINQGYREQVFPLRENNVAHNIMEGKPLSSNIASQFSGDQVGQPLLREIALRNPQVRRNIVGQSYKGNINNLQNADETLREYMNQMPELQQLMNVRNQSQQAAQRAEQEIQRARDAHGQALQREKEAHAESKVEKSKKMAEEKEHKTQLTAHEKNRDELQKQIGKHSADIKKIEKEISNLELHVKKIQEQTKKKDQTLEQKVKAENKIKKLKDEIRANQRALRSANFGYKHALKLMRRVVRHIPGLRRL